MLQCSSVLDEDIASAMKLTYQRPVTSTEVALFRKVLFLVFDSELFKFKNK